MTHMLPLFGQDPGRGEWLDPDHSKGQVRRNQTPGLFLF